MVDFTDQVVIVTGAGRGLGREYALDFARRGAAVIVNDIGGTMRGDGIDQSVADSVVDEIVGFGGRATASYDSVATPKGAEAIVATATSNYRRLDAVVSNAGTYSTAPFDEMTSAQWENLRSVHLDGGFYLSQAAFRVMKAQDYGRFVFVSSSAGLFGQPDLAHYASMKAGLLGLSNVISIEGEKHGIQSNLILPFGVSRMVIETLGGEEAAAEMGLTEAIDPQLAVPMVTFLASRACDFTHRAYSAGAGCYSRVFVGRSEGWMAAKGEKPSAEQIAERIGEISDTERHTIPDSIFDEFAILLARHGMS